MMRVFHMKSYPFHSNMQNVLQNRYYNINERKEGKYLVQTRSQDKSSAITLPELHRVVKGINPNILPEKARYKNL